MKVNFDKQKRYDLIVYDQRLAEKVEYKNVRIVYEENSFFDIADNIEKKMIWKEDLVSVREH